MSCYADGVPTLELPCTATSPQVRLGSLHHVLRHCTVLVLVQVCKHRLASTCPLLTVLAGSISSLSIEAVEDCLIGLPIGLALQPARVPVAVPDR